MADDKDRGLYTKYILFNRIACDCGADRHCQECEGRGFNMVPVDPAGEYFVLRIDKDDWHGEASRVALAAYAWMVAKTNQALELDLKRLVTHSEPDNGHPLVSMAAGRAAENRFREYMAEVAAAPEKAARIVEEFSKTAKPPTPR